MKWSILKECFIIFSLTVICGSLFFSIDLILRSLFVNELLIQTVSAFAGALFAFLFVRLADFLDAIYKRQKLHYNSLVTLETQLNEIGTIMHDNLYIMPNFRRVILTGNVYFNNLHTVFIDKSHYEKLYDIQLLNELFSYNYQLRRINDDIETITNGYNELKSVLFQTNNLDHYKANTKLMAEQLQILEAFIKDIQEQTIKLWARIRVQIRNDIPLGTRISRWIYKSPSTPNRIEIKKQETAIKNEIEESKSKSEVAIQEIINKMNAS